MDFTMHDIIRSTKNTNNHQKGNQILTQMNLIVSPELIKHN